MTGHKSPSHHHGLCRELHTAESEMLATSPHTSGVTGSTCPLQGASPCVSQDFLGDRHSGGSGCAPVLRHLSPCQSRAEPDPEGREKTPPWASRLLPAPLLEFSASVTVHPSPCPLPVPSAFFTYQLKQAIHVLPVRGAHSQRNSPCDLSLSHLCPSQGVPGTGSVHTERASPSQSHSLCTQRRALRKRKQPARGHRARVKPLSPSPGLAQGLGALGRLPA